MGLDSVMLVVEIENGFNIQISDAQCLKIYTVQDFANTVYDIIKIHPTEKCLTQSIFHKIRKSLVKLNIAEKTIQRNSKILDLLTETELKEHWKNIEKEIKLELPELVPFDSNEESDAYVKFLGFKMFKRTRFVRNATIEQLIDWTVSLNYKELIDIEKISSKYEIERITVGIISEKIGISICEIELEHNISLDLGVD